jgi:NAD+ kinase
VVQIPGFGQDREVAPPGLASDCEFLVALGGDGTVLAALHAAALAGKPVLGVGCGSLGALTSVHASRIADGLDRVLEGDWRARRLPALRLESDVDEPALHALNDFVFIRGGAGQLSVSVSVDDELYIRFGGDGLVVSTALGSSAYTLAANGPLLAPGASGMVITPLAPHGGSCPPLVAGPESRFEIVVEPGHGGARLESDGQSTAELERFEPRRFAISLQPEYTTLAMLDDQEPMLAGLRRRRIVMDSPRLLARDERLAASAAQD